MSQDDRLDLVGRCTCVTTTRDLPPCPAHGPIPTAHYRQLAEAEVESLRSQLRGAVEALEAVEDWFGKPTPATEAATVAGLDEVLRKVHRALHGGRRR
jgi:hypothetical protein